MMQNRSTAARNGFHLGALAAITLAWAQPLAAAEPAGRGSYQDLLALFGDYSKWSFATGTGKTTDFRPQAIAARKAELKAFQNRLTDMNVVAWSPAQKVDYLTVRSQLDKQDFILNVTRPWARDPGYYLDSIQRTAFTELPVSGAALDTLRSNLRAIPGTLAQARLALTDVASDHADLAIDSLAKSDGVEDGYPYRATPPAGVIGWYRDLLGRAEGLQPALKPDINKAIAELESYRQWLVANRSRMNGRAGVGKEALDWYLRNALLMPYTSRDVETLGQRELDRFWGFYTLERFRNRGLPEIDLPPSNEEYLRRLAETDARIREFLVEKEFLTIPPSFPSDWRRFIVPPYTEPFNVPFIKRATPPNFWEQVQFRDPSPDHLHAVIPGHRFDNMMARLNPNPIRRAAKDGARWQGWAVYLEEAALQAGFFEDKPRVRELIQIFGLWRASRTLGDLWNQLNEKNASEVVDYWMDVTPMLDRNVARKYAHIRALPGHGLEYTMGTIQMWNLLAERRRQLGDKFVLKDFHDEFIRKGQIPMSLIRYEMTGKDDEVKMFWDRQPMPAPAS
jgi:hypothetical protein